MKVKITKNKKNEFTDDKGNTFKSMDDMLAYHGLIFTNNKTKAKPIQYVYVDENGNEVTLQ